MDTEGHPERPVPTEVPHALLHTVTGFASWTPPRDVRLNVFDYRERVERHHRAGFFDAADRAALHALPAGQPPLRQVQHGDPLPANLVLTESGDRVLLDFEFTGLFLPGFDLAMSHTLFAATPGAQDAVETLVRDAGIEASFLLNRAMVLSRERRLYSEAAGDPRLRRPPRLDSQWEELRSRLHGRG
ncbi:aminoglycoside phosphotransferase (APT) family kinase protein [Actinoalloteichus hoggarensis]|uniref:phosphotransferase family protein n=1 Tax=Actinoalloteichus hoggarensis TaxID=1470176 RepID=UPI001832D674|nr:phosphotransferase [Actinoalloteichus hoggarensis]MBB5922253.1 aminoglycoside phosphotransferase (APT) family kinase protein [Actinoalloteichus hoggarensis]